MINTEKKQLINKNRDKIKIREQDKVTISKVSKDSKVAASKVVVSKVVASKALISKTYSVNLLGANFREEEVPSRDKQEEVRPEGIEEVRVGNKVIFKTNKRSLVSLIVSISHSFELASHRNLKIWSKIGISFTIMSRARTLMRRNLLRIFVRNLASI